jgi:hypothetical protein
MIFVSPSRLDVCSIKVLALLGYYRSELRDCVLNIDAGHLASSSNGRRGENSDDQRDLRIDPG